MTIFYTPRFSLLLSGLVLVACGDAPFGAQCQTDGDCKTGELCANKVCVTYRLPIMLDAGNTTDSAASPDAGDRDSFVATDLAHPDQRALPDNSPLPDNTLSTDTRSSPDTTTLPDSANPADAWLAVDSSDPNDTGATQDAIWADVATTDSSPADAGSADVGCTADNECSSGLCNLNGNICQSVACIYDEHCSGYYNNHCGEGQICVSAHDCSTEMGSIPYPWDDSMSVTVEGNTSDADSRFSPTSSCGSADGPEDIFSLRLPRSVQKVTVQMSALPNPDSWDTHVYVAASICGSTNLGCEDWAVSLQPEILILTNPTDSVVTIVADGYSSNSSGPYRLTLTIDECNTASDCSAQEQCLAPATDHSRCVQP